MARQKNDGRGRLGGRQKGTPNKATTGIREAIAQRWKEYHESGQFKKDIDDLEPQERVSIMEKYAQFISPKMKSVDLDLAAASDNISITARLIEMSKTQD